MTARLEKGYVHLYTGNGKGKTTAALGLALRAAGAGLNVYFAQFVKGQATSELKSLKKFSRRITVRQFGRRTYIKGRTAKADRTLACRGLEAVEKAVQRGMYDVIILDEICVACRYNLISVKKVLAIIENRPQGVEVIITGRNAHQELIEASDLVTEMREIKHYFIGGVNAREGIEY